MSCTGVLLDGSCSDSGGGASTLQEAYNNSTIPEIVLSTPPGALVIRDNATPLSGDLFDVQNNSGSVSYLSVNSSGVNIDGKLSVTGLIDPTGLVLDDQVSTPGGNPGATKGTIWVNNTTPNHLMFTDNTNSVHGITPSPSDILTTVGDLLGENYSGPARVPIGSNGQFLRADTSSSVGLSYAAISTNVKTFRDSGGVPVSLSSATLTTAFTYNYNGATTDGAISAVKVVSYLVAAGSYTIRLYDMTNSLTIATVSGQTNTTEAIIDLGTISNIPLSSAILVIQLSLDSGVGPIMINYSSIELGTSSVSAENLQDVYNQSTNGFITVDNVRGLFGIKDNTMPLATNLFEVDNNSGATKYFAVSSSETVVGGALNLPNLTANAATYINNSNNLTSVVLTNGELLIGSNGVSPVPNTLTGTTNQVNVANGAGSITLSLPQSIAPGSSPTFVSETLTAVNNQLTLGSVNTTTINSVAPAASRVYNIVDAGTNSSFVMTDSSQTINGNKTFSSGFTVGLNGIVNLPNQTTSSAVYINASNNLASTALTNGQLLIGSTGANPVPSTLTGTANQVNIANGTGTITLSLPQSIAPSNTPSFASESLTNTTNQLTLGSTNTTTISAPTPGSSITLTLPSSASDTLVARNTTDTLTNKTITSGTNNVYANALNSATTNVIVNGATAPSSGQVLTATSSTAANWQPIPVLTVSAPVNATDGNGIIVSGQNVQLEYATASEPGILSSGTQTISGLKTLAISDSSNIENVADPTKILAFSLGGNTTGKTLTVATAQTNSETLNVPNIVSTDIIATLGLNNVFTGSDSFTSAVMITPVTNQLILGTTHTTTVSAPAPASSITLTLPSTASDTLVAKNTTDALTNKTITSATNNVYANAINSTTTNVLTNGAPAPNIGQVLTATSSSSANWQTPTLTVSAPVNATDGNGIIVSGQNVQLEYATASEPGILSSSTQTISGLKTLSISDSSSIESASDSTKALAFSVGGNTTGKTLTVATAQTNTETLNVPNIASTDTIATLGLGNTFTGSNTFTSEVAITPVTNQLVLGTANTTTLSAPAPASSITLTLPSSASDTLVARNTTDTLTNKTITSGTNNVYANAINSATTNVIVNGATAPSSGQVLTATSSTAANWQSPTLTVSAPVNATDGNGIIVSGQNVQLEFATATEPGILSSGTQTISGLKTLNVSDTSNIENSTDATKKLVFSLAGNTTGKTLTLATAQTNTETLNVPNISATDTIATLGSANTFSATNTFNGVTDFTNTINISNLGSNVVPYINGSNNLVSYALTNGQIIIGLTGSTPQASTVTGTSNQVIVTNGAGSITLSTPQNIANSSSPTFASETLTNVTNQLTLGTTHTTTLSATAPAASRTYTIIDTGANSNFIMTDSNQAFSGTTTFNNTTNFTSTVNISDLGSNVVLYLDGSNNLNSYALTNGQIVIGLTGSTPQASTITGTTNQINVANGAGSITLSTPQNINSGASPTFASETLTNTTNQLTLGVTHTTTINSVSPAASRTYIIPDAGTNSSFIMADGNETLNGNNTYAGTASFTNATNSTTSSTGAVLLSGGMGITKNLFVGGSLGISASGIFFGSTGATLSTYNIIGATTSWSTSPFANTTTFTFSIVGTDVTMTWPNIGSATATSATVFLSATTFLPAAVIPTTTKNFIVWGQNAAANALVVCNINSNGSIQFGNGVADGSFTSGQAAAVWSGSITYQLNV